MNNLYSYLISLTDSEFELLIERLERLTVIYLKGEK
jgi:hypothetical protein